MNLVVPVLFNLLGNALLSFLFALGFALLTQRMLRLQPGRLRLSLWLLPLAKVLWDLARGIPAHSFVWVHALGAKQDLGVFRVGLALERARPPWLQAVLGARSNGATYSQSAADLLFRALSMKVSPFVPKLLVALVLAVSVARLGRRAWGIVALRRRTRGLIARGNLLQIARGAWRAVPVYVSEAYDGMPFAAGVAHPFVLFSRRGFDALPPSAQSAAIAHEVAHIERLDPLWILLLLAFGDLFWFLPGLGNLLSRVLAEVELCADARAVRRGTPPEDLADALLRASESLYVTPEPALGLTGKKSLLRQRIEQLCAPVMPRSAWRRLLSASAVALVCAIVLYSVLFGNYLLGT